MELWVRLPPAPLKSGTEIGDVMDFYEETPDGGVRRIKPWEALDLRPRRIALTEIGGMEVSTVFTVTPWGSDEDETPLLYETMVFGGHGQTVTQRRYTSRRDALLGHEKLSSKSFIDCLLWDGFGHDAGT